VPFIVGQVDDDGVFVEASELRRVIVGIAEDWMKERLACALYNDGLAGRPANIHRVRRNAIEVCERALDGSTVDICPVHESYFQFESKKCSNPIVVYGQAPFGRELPTALAIQAFAINLRRHPNAPDGLPHFVNNRS
jgi:hypothetical protein